MRRALVALLLLFTGVGNALADDSQELVIQNAWIREAPPGVSSLAGYLELTNNSRETVVLQTVTSEIFERVELHRTRIEGDMARMEHKSELTLSPGQTVRFKPGDYHLMMFNPSRPLRAGDKVRLNFLFKDLPTREVEASVRDYSGNPDDHHH